MISFAILLSYKFYKPIQRIQHWIRGYKKQTMVFFALYTRSLESSQTAAYHKQEGSKEVSFILSSTDYVNNPCFQKSL